MDQIIVLLVSDSNSMYIEVNFGRNLEATCHNPNQEYLSIPVQY